MALGDGDLAPDRIPDWLKDSVRRSKGRNLDDFSILNEFYKEENVVRADKFDTGQYRSMRDKADELDELAKHEELNKALVTDRNLRWVGRIEDLLDDDDDYLIIVGALHLIGPDG
ncbi:MAG: TraB/GumN family protein, partial [Acidobacteriota bacterium]